ncbi:hypothetical protein TKK_0014505 [Trichogramma kaykai]
MHVFPDAWGKIAVIISTGLRRDMSSVYKEFHHLKNLLMHAPILKYFGVNKPVTLSCDASQHGLGAVILQEGLPVAYTSRSLTLTETKYAQIEKEALAIVFTCTKFHQYTLGKKTLVESDHKPLVYARGPQRLRTVVCDTVLLYFRN